MTSSKKQQIAIKPENYDSIRNLLEREQARCSARKLTLEQITSLVQSSDNWLEKIGVAPSARAGCRREFAEAVPNSYRSGPSGTRIVIRRLSNGFWTIEVLSREDSPRQPYGGARDNLFLTEKAKSSAIVSLMKKHDVRNMPSRLA